MQEFVYKILDDGNYAVMGYQGDETKVVIPDHYGKGKVTVLGDSLFCGHTEITEVILPDCVTDMGEFIFDGCTGLKQINLPKELTSLWGYTFVRSSFEEIILPDKLSTLPPFAFKDCKNLKRVVCGKGLKKIYSWVFGGCDALKEVLYDGGVEVSPEAFLPKVLNS